MPLNMNRNVFITCAVTGSGDTTGKSDKVPVTPEQIAASAIDAAKAGAAVVHCHVRNPETGAPSRDVELFREVTERIRDAEIDVVLNLTAGMGGDLVLGGVETPLPPDAAGTDMAGASERLRHIADCLPELCTLDCGTMNFGHGDYIMTNSTAMLVEMATQMKALGVKPVPCSMLGLGDIVIPGIFIALLLRYDSCAVAFCRATPTRVRLAAHALRPPSRRGRAGPRASPRARTFGATSSPTSWALSPRLA